MRKQLIETIIDTLRSSFGEVRVPISDEQLFKCYRTGDYHGMVYIIQKFLHLDTRLFLGIVRNGGPKHAPAWIRMNRNSMPMINTAEFRELKTTIYIRGSFLERARFEGVVVAIAHELCHLLLDSVRHSLRFQEEAVDLTAMLLGFRDFYVTSPYYSMLGPICFGYLTIEEINHSSSYMTLS